MGVSSRAYRKEAKMATATATHTTTTLPIVVDLGKKSRKQIKSLKRGKGKLMNDVAAAMEEVKTNLGPEAVGKEFVPVVIIYRKKDRGRGGRSWFPIGF